MYGKFFIDFFGAFLDMFGDGLLGLEAEGSVTSGTASVSVGPIGKSIGPIG